MTDLISFINKSYNQYLLMELKDLDISPSQIRFILFLKLKSNSSQDDLAKYLSLSRGTTAKALRKLDDEDLIERKVVPENRRKYGVALTSKGEEMANKIEEIDKKWEKSIYGEFQDNKKEIAMKILKEIAFSSMKTVGSENASKDIFDFHDKVHHHHHHHHNCNEHPSLRHLFNFKKF